MLNKEDLRLLYGDALNHACMTPPDLPNTWL